MAKNDTARFIGGFGEAFLKTLQAERESRLKQEQWNQEMAFQTRQYNLLNQVRQKKLQMEMNEPYETKTGDIYGREDGVVNFNQPVWEMPLAPPKPQAFDIEGSYKNSETGTYWTFDKNVGQPRDLGIPYDKNEGKSTTNINMPTEKNPYVPTKDLDKTWNLFQELDVLDKKWGETSEDKRTIVNDKGEVIKYDNYQDLRKAKDKIFKEIETETKDRAKKLGEEYVGFNSVFNDLMRDPDFKRMPTKEKDAYISRIMNGFPDEAIRQMKDLISKRVF